VLSELQSQLQAVLADLDEAFVRLALDTRNDEQGIDCLTRARKAVGDILTDLDQEKNA
jgi:hypothetical protein